MNHPVRFCMTAKGRHIAILVMATLLSRATPTVGQYGPGIAGMGTVATAQSFTAGQASGFTGSVPSGAATDEVLHLTLRDAINRALRYNLATIESGENARIARGQRLVALSKLLPQISSGVSENVEQVSVATLGIKTPIIPAVIGPYAYSSADVSLSQTSCTRRNTTSASSATTSPSQDWIWGVRSDCHLDSSMNSPTNFLTPKSNRSASKTH
jgi:outer membrane protein TolC